MKKKPSSIEWLVDQFKEYDFSEEDGMYLIKIPSWLLAEKEEKAKAMHKEEVESAWVIGCDNGYDKACDNITWDEMDNNKYNYYNETFGGDNE